MKKQLAYDYPFSMENSNTVCPLENGAPLHQSVRRQRLDDMIKRGINGISRDKQVKIAGRDHAIVDQCTEVDYLIPVFGSEKHQR